MEDDEKTPYDSGRESAENNGSWRDNPHSPGTRAWFEFEDGRQDGGADDVGPAPGTPSWA